MFKILLIIIFSIYSYSSPHCSQTEFNLMMDESIELNIIHKSCGKKNFTKLLQKYNKDDFKPIKDNPNLVDFDVKYDDNITRYILNKEINRLVKKGVDSKIIFKTIFSYIKLIKSLQELKVTDNILKHIEKRFEIVDVIEEATGSKFEKFQVKAKYNMFYDNYIDFKKETDIQMLEIKKLINSDANISLCFPDTFIEDEYYNDKILNIQEYISNRQQLLKIIIDKYFKGETSFETVLKYEEMIYVGWLKLISFRASYFIKNNQLFLKPLDIECSKESFKISN